MRSKRVWRYYCDHCRKGSCGKASMIKHESRCIKNPQRKCGFCERMEFAPVAMPELMKALGSGDVDALRQKSNGCPACMLAAIVQSKITEPDEDGYGPYIGFVYKEEVERFWKEREPKEIEF